MLALRWKVLQRDAPLRKGGRGVALQRAGSTSMETDRRSCQDSTDNWKPDPIRAVAMHVSKERGGGGGGDYTSLEMHHTSRQDITEAWRPM